MSRRWVGALGIAVAIAGVAIACGDDPVPVASTPPDAAKVPPGNCTLTPTPTPLCVLGVDSIPDAGAVDAAAVDGGGVVVAPESENRCLVTYDGTLDCPSLVGSITSGMGAAAGDSAGTELMVTLRGISPGDYQGYPQRVSIDPTQTVAVTNPIAEPYSYSGFVPSHSVMTIGAPPALVVTTADDEKGTSSTLHFGPTLEGSLSIPLGPNLHQYVFTAPGGEGFLAGRAGYRTPFIFVRGLPHSPRIVANSVPGQGFGLAVDTTGEPAGLFIDAETETLHLLEGETFARERWSAGTRAGGANALLELGYVKGAAVFVVRPAEDDETHAYWVHDGEAAPTTASPAHTARIGESYSTCPRANYLGVTCDACPVGQQCVAGEDGIVSARMFTRGDRAFFAYVAHDTRRLLAYAKHTVPIIGVGCSCVLEEVSRQLSGDSLIVLELFDGGPGAAPLLKERMRLPLTGVPDVLIQLDRRPDGDLNVVLGPEPPMVGSEGTTPAGPYPTHRIIRISTALIPIGP